MGWSFPSKSRVLGLGALHLLVVGCPDTVAGTADTDTDTAMGTDFGSSSTSSTSVGSTSPTAEGSSGDSSSGDTTADTSSAGDETTGTTGDPIANGRGRFAVRVGEGIGDELVLVEYTDGRLQPEIDLLAGLPEDLLLSTTGTADDGRLLVSCWRVLPSAAQTCGIIDLASDPPGPFQSLASGAVPEGALIRYPSWAAATQTLWFVPSVLPDDDDVGIFAAQVTDGELGPSQLVFELPEAQTLVDFSVGPDGLQLGYALEAEDGATASYVMSADPLDDTAPVLISAPVPPDQRTGVPTFLPEASAAYYVVREDAIGPPNLLSLWFVDLSGESPAAPVRMDTLTGAERRLHVRAPAPDRHALTYGVEPVDDVLAGELMWIDLSSGSPQPAVPVSTLSPGAVSIRSARWSPDSRWLGYEADLEGPDSAGLHLVDGSGSVPGAPIHVSEGLVAGGRVWEWAFDQDAQWVYMVAQIDEENPGLFRVDVSSDTPGPVQAIDGPKGWVDEELVFSHDGSALLHSASEGSVRQLALADISGELVEPSIVLNGPLPKGNSVTFGPRFSADDSVVAYVENTPDPDTPRRLRLADRSAGEVVEVDFGDRSAGAVHAAPQPR